MIRYTFRNQYSAAALYDGGWRASDREELIGAYELTPEEADAIVADLREIEEEERDEQAERRIYLAYGSNLNMDQMYNRCPNAEFLGTGFLQDWKLVFRRGYLTVEPEKGCELPFALWSVNKEDEKALDRYEGYPKFYYTLDTEVRYTDMLGRESKAQAFFYRMHTKFPYEIPSWRYWETCAKGYEDCVLDEVFLEDALKETRRLIREEKKHAADE